MNLELVKIINKADIVDITLSKRDYLVFKNAARAEEKKEKEEKKEEKRNATQNDI